MSTSDVLFKNNIFWHFKTVCLKKYLHIGTRKGKKKKTTHLNHMSPHFISFTNFMTLFHYLPPIWWIIYQNSITVLEFMWQLFTILQKILILFKCNTVYNFRIINNTKTIISIDTKIKYSLFAPQESFSTHSASLFQYSEIWWGECSPSVHCSYTLKFCGYFN